MFKVLLKQWPAVIIFLSALFGNAFALQHFHLADSITGVYAYVYLDTIQHPTLNGTAIKAGDEIAVFDSLGKCYGAANWPAAVESTFTIEGYNVNGPGGGNPGMMPGGTMYFRVWDTTLGEMPASVTYYPIGTSVPLYPHAVTPTMTSQFGQNENSVPKSITGLLAPAAPLLALPTNGAGNVSILPVLSWGSVANATMYEVEVSASSAFGSTVYDQSGATLTSATVSPSLANGASYYWRANASNTGGTSWSNAWSFKTIVAAPSAPALALPTNGAGNVSITPALSWGSVANATMYEVEISASSAFGSTVYDQRGASLTSATVSPGLANGASYYWRANASNTGGTSWSGAWSFTTIVTAPSAPALALPTNGAGNVSITPALSWGSVANATMYEVEVSASSAFGSTVYDQRGATLTSATVSPGLANSASYYWRANASNTGGTSWSSVWSFTTIAIVAPSAPTLTSPTNGATGQSLAPALSWTTVTGASSYGYQISAVSTFATTLHNQTGLTTTSASTSGLANNTVYYWRANATNTTGTSAWSTVWSFTTLVATAVPALSSPANGATNEPTSLTMTWGSATGAISYNLQVSLVSTFAATVSNQAGITGTSGGVTGLATITTYYWRANATNGGGTGAWSGAWSFTTVPPVPVAPALTSPANDANFSANTTVTLVWGTVEYATTYTAQVSTVSTFTTTVFNQSGATVSAALVPSAGATFYWRVNAGDTSGHSAWSGVWSFVISTAVLPTVGNELHSIVVSFAHGALSYSLKAQTQVDITLFDILGKRALNFGFLQAAGSYRLPLQSAALPSGRYLLRFKAGGLSRDLAITITR